MELLGNALTTVSTEYGIDRKRLSKNVSILKKDIIQFGHLSYEEITRTAARMTHMKVKMEDAAAVFKKFSTFEDAANSVAMLSQTFGMNLNAMDLLQAKKPEEIFTMFRDAMDQTGRAFDDLNRFEKELMVQLIGWYMINSGVVLQQVEKVCGLILHLTLMKQNHLQMMMLIFMKVDLQREYNC